jgi:outer membrane protein assembly factor BamB
MKIGCLTAGLIAFGALTPALIAEDWPEWRGPERNGISRETNWLREWPEGRPPAVAWRAQVGKGHSAVSVAGGRAYTLGWDGRQDTVYCFDAASGKVLWKHTYPCAGILQWPGPRSTPTVRDGVVYTLSQHGLLHALDAKTGDVRWQVQLAASYNPDVDYGFAWSPLVVGDLLLLAAGSKGLALRTRDGAFAWGNDGLHGACASPVPYRFGNETGAALITTNRGRDSVSLIGVNPSDGRELWRSEPWIEKWGAACVDLLCHDGKVFITTAEQHQRCARFSVRGGKLVEDWSHNKLAGYTGGCVLIGGHIYAVNSRGILKCLDWETGDEKWVQRGFDERGTLIAADGKLLIQTGKSGALVVAAAAPEGYRELRRATVFPENPDTYTAPVLANGRIYCRSYEGEVVCLKVRD